MTQVLKSTETFITAAEQAAWSFAPSYNSVDNHNSIKNAEGWDG